MLWLMLRQLSEKEGLQESCHTDENRSNDPSYFPTFTLVSFLFV